MLPVERWTNAISKRHSTRNYNGEAIEAEKMEALGAICRSFSPADSVRAVLVAGSGSEMFKGLIGSYGKIKNNPAFLAFIGRTDRPDVNEMAGYLGEGIILEATALGLSTCWVGGMFRQEAAERRVALDRGEALIALSPVGYPLEKITFEERMMRGFKTKQKRKLLANIASGLTEEQWPDWVSAGLQAARVAPSAMNRQPWRFLVEEESVVLSSEDKKDISGISRRLDCGIAMLHFELGALSRGVALQKELLAAPRVARFHSPQLINNGLD